MPRKRKTTVIAEEAPSTTEHKGRKRGTPNRVSATVKENILAVFTRIGGTAAMARWATKNPTEFYKIYAKLLPTQITGEDGDPVKVAIQNAKDTLAAKIAAILEREG